MTDRAITATITMVAHATIAPDIARTATGIVRATTAPAATRDQSSAGTAAGSSSQRHASAGEWHVGALLPTALASRIHPGGKGALTTIIAHVQQRLTVL